MKAATEIAKEILRKQEAIRKTKSTSLKIDYSKSIQRDENELLFYCRSRHLDVGEVFEKAKKVLQTEAKGCKMEQERREKSMKEKILAYRKKHGISQRELAKRCGISPTTVERLEKGGEPSTIVTGKLEKVFMEDKK